MTHLRLLACSTVAALSAFAFPRAQQPRLLRDINQAPLANSSRPRELTAAANGWYYFTARQGRSGRQLFRTRAMPGTVERITVIGGTLSEDPPAEPTAIGGKVVFVAFDDRHGFEPWVTDVATRRTELLRDLVPGREGSAPRDFVAVNGSVLFATAQGLWRTDGTGAGTQRIKALPYVGPGPFGVLGTSILFTADDGSGRGRELWTSDGSPAGTVMLEDLVPGVLSYELFRFVTAGPYVYFFARGFVGEALWRTDGTPAGTIGLQRMDVNTLGHGVDLAGDLIVTAKSQLWRSDGTPGGTTILHDFPGAGSIGPLTRAGSQVYFNGWDTTHGVEPWSSDGSTVGTKLLADLQPGSVGSGIGPAAAAGNRLFFMSSDANARASLWVSDGSTAGTNSLAQIDPRAYSRERTHHLLGLPGGRVLFDADDTRSGSELWWSDGTTAGTKLLANVAPDGNSGSFPARFVDIGGTAFFSADDGVTGRELWSSDGTTAGTRRVQPGLRTGPATTGNYGRFGGVALFVAETTATGREPWRSDGTAAGTRLLHDIAPGSASSMFFGDFVSFGGHTYFAAENPAHGSELWRSDGNGAQRFADLNPGPASSWPSGYRVVDNSLYFSATVAPYGRELVRVDSTGLGTRVLDLRSGTLGSNAQVVARLASGELLLTASIDPFGTELWRTDGTVAGTKLVRDLHSGQGDTIFAGFAEFGSAVVFAVRKVNRRGFELWTTDGSTSGTVRLAEFPPRVGFGTFDLIGRVGNAVLFVPDEPQYGRELWRTDGTVAGTRLIKDIHPLGSGVKSSTLSVGTRYVFFRGDDGIHGPELWRTDGTPTGTQMIEVVPGPDGSNAFPIGVAGGKLYFSAAQPGTGDELWVLEPGAMARLLGSGCGAGPRVPTIAAADPVLGRTVTIRGEAAYVGSNAFALLSLPRTAIATPGVPCEIWIDPAAAGLLATFPVRRSSWSLPLPVPDLPALTGLRAHLQVAMAPSDSPFGMDLTPGLELVFGR